ncbi:Glutathione peroxidase 7, partial [Ophiophagus hannah]
MLIVVGALLFLAFSASEQKEDNFYSFKVVNIRESTGEEPTWNFWKYLVDPDGKAVNAWDSTVTVEEIKPYIIELVRQLILKKKMEL